MRRATELLRRVAAGETIDAVSRDRTDAGPLERLRAAGEAALGQGDLADLAWPLNLEPDQEAPSAVLERLRADER